MSDLIDRKAAIEALGEEPPIFYDGEDEIAERDQWRRDVNAIKALPSAQPEQRWISVEERLPEDRSFVGKLICDSYGDIRVPWECATIELRGKTRYYDGVECLQRLLEEHPLNELTEIEPYFTHWMPLPKPPIPERYPMDAIPLPEIPGSDEGGEVNE